MIKIIDIHKRYKSKKGPDHKALNGIDLEFGSKGFVVLLGKSGSGKSTLLNILGGLDKFDRGEIIIKGKSTKDFKNNEWDSYRNTYVGFIFQEFYIIEEYTVGKNIALALELQGYDKEEIPNRVEEILASVELDGYKDRKPNEISGGQKQRIAIARALVKDPKILLADEPTGNLDSDTGKAILETLKELSKEKLVIMVTHDVDFAHQYGDRIIELKDGEILSDIINDKNKQNNEIITVDEEGNEVIKLEAGKQLSNVVINKINNLLGNTEDKVYIEISDDKNYIKTIIPEINNQEKHETISYDYLKYNENDNSFSLKKSSLNFMNALKLAVSSIFTKKIRLTFMMILFIASLVFLGFATNLSFYDSDKATYLTFNETGTSEVLLRKQVKNCHQYGDGQQDCYYIDGSASFNDIITLKDRYQSINFNEIYSIDIMFDNIPSELGEENNIKRGINKPYYRFTEHINYMLVLESTNTFDQKIIAGANIVDTNDVLITDFIADILLFKQVYGELENIDDLIGKEIPFDGYRFKISGIIDTDYEKYDDLKEETDYHVLYESKFYQEVENNFSKMITTSENIISMKNNIETFYTYMNASRENHLDDDGYNDTNTHFLSSMDFYKLSVIDESKLKLLESSKLPQNNDEILLPLSHVVKILNWDNGEEITREDVINNKDNILDKVINSKIYFNPGSNNWKEYTIIGVNDNYNEDGRIDNFNVIVNDDLFKEVYDLNLYLDFQAVLGDNDKENFKFLSDLNDLKFKHRTNYSDMLYELEWISTEMRPVYYWIGGVFSFFAAILIFTFVSSSIMAKKKEIGTLRAIGARGIDVSKIYIIEGMIITLFAGTVASILTNILVRFLNKDITKSFDLDIVLLYHNIMSIIAIFGLGILVTAIASYIPVKRITVMKPIDAIKNK